jgi:hypothetical protein
VFFATVECIAGGSGRRLYGYVFKTKPSAVSFVEHVIRVLYMPPDCQRGATLTYSENACSVDWEHDGKWLLRGQKDWRKLFWPLSEVRIVKVFGNVLSRKVCRCRYFTSGSIAAVVEVNNNVSGLSQQGLQRNRTRREASGLHFDVSGIDERFLGLFQSCCSDPVGLHRPSSRLARGVVLKIGSNGQREAKDYETSAEENLPELPPIEDFSPVRHSWIVLGLALELAGLAGFVRGFWLFETRLKEGLGLVLIAVGLTVGGSCFICLA